MAGVTDLPASERTPLLSGTTPTSARSSFHSPVAASPAIRISAMPPQSHSNSRPHSYASSNSSQAIRTISLQLRSNSSLTSSIPHIPNLHGSYGRSPSICISRNSLDNLRARSYLVSPHSVYSPINSRLGSSYMPGSSNAASSYLVASSSRQSYLRHCAESEASLSALASTNSLPGC